MGLLNFSTYWIKFEFYSDGSVHNYEGAYIDSLIITGNRSNSLTKGNEGEPWEELIEGKVPQIISTKKPPAESFDSVIIPERFVLQQNYPNPFNPKTTISYVPYLKRDMCWLQIFDTNGRLVRNLKDDHQEAGIHHLQGDATDDSGNKVATGIYICRMRAGNEVFSWKIVFAK